MCAVFTVIQKKMPQRVRPLLPIDLLNLIGSFLGDARYSLEMRLTPHTHQLSTIMYEVPRKNIPKQVFQAFPALQLGNRYRYYGMNRNGVHNWQVFLDDGEIVFY